MVFFVLPDLFFFFICRVLEQLFECHIQENKNRLDEVGTASLIFSLSTFPKCSGNAPISFLVYITIITNGEHLSLRCLQTSDLPGVRHSHKKSDNSQLSLVTLAI